MSSSTVATGANGFAKELFSSGKEEGAGCFFTLRNQIYPAGPEIKPTTYRSKVRFSTIKAAAAWRHR